MGEEDSYVKESTRIAALIIATLANFLTPFMSSAINIALPAIGAEFGSSAILLSWVPTSFLLAAAMFSVPFGRIADIYGMKKIFSYGIIIFTVASLLSALAPSTIALIVFRIIQGVGAAMIFVTGLAIITSVYPPFKRGKAIGINIATVYIGLSLGPVLGGIMTQYLGWRSLFYLAVPLGILIFALTLWKLEGEWAVCHGEKFDALGSIFYSIVLVTVMYGVSILPSNNGLIMITLGIVGLLAFVIWELRTESPVLNIKIFKNTTFAFSNLAALINYSSTFAVTFLLSLYLQYIRGLDAQSAGIILVAQPVIMAIFSPIAGKLSDRFEPQIIASLGMAISTIGIFTFTFLTPTTSLTLLIIGLMVLGFGFALFSSPNTNAIMGSVEKRFYGVASAMVSTMRLIGQMFSMGLALMVFAIFIGNVQITTAQYPALLSSIHTVFIICTVLCFIGIFASIARGKKRSKNAQK
ncbi:MFS transporter [Methanobacterium aggregans]|uniref:MFS transporter n=1 Tax=Methanobacterium aggregans TaxID=1615586 RepID=UPI001AE6DD83|nr:MFS transporter [Methanobacterium aggregans]MBP2045436.1 EmrB/QacA subfamily drug resistance transporter [Methanobacterium aggregans]